MSETRKIAAILAADVVGFSRLAGADEDRTLARLRALRSDLIDPTIAVHHGRVVKRTGDGLLVEFRSVVDAVRCAIEIQNAMLDRNAGVPVDRRIEFRIGIHLGDVVEESDGDLMGDGVNIASRLEGIAKPGAICLSEDAYRHVKGRLEIAAVDLGPTQLKNIAEPVRAYALQVDARAEAKPEAETKPSPTKRFLAAPLALAIAALLIVIAAGAWYWLAMNRAPVVAMKGRLSIVVLPFANLSGDPAQDNVADALTDELTTGLARVNGSFVIARNTAFTYKGKPVDAKAIGKDLGVRYVLEGSVQQSGAQVRVNAQLIDADSGAQVWAEQFDTARADLLQMQDDIVTRLVRALEYELPQAAAARVKQTPSANPDAEDLAVQCGADIRKAGFFGKEAEAGYRVCEQALTVDPNNVRALVTLSVKYWIAVGAGVSANPEADLDRADELISKALALDPNYAYSHHFKAIILLNRRRVEEAIAENERAIALDPSLSDAFENLGDDYTLLGQFEKSLELYDKAIRLSPHDPGVFFWFSFKSFAYFGLKQYDQAIEWARKSIAINGAFAYPRATLVAALSLSGRDTEAHEALQSYLSEPRSGPSTIAGWKAHWALSTDSHSDPRILESISRIYEGLRKAGMPD